MRKMDVEWMVREELPITGELQEENQDVSAATGLSVNTAAIRITFFRAITGCEQPEDLCGVSNEIMEASLLGFAVIVTHSWNDAQKEERTHTHVLEAVVRTPSVWATQPCGASVPSGVCNYYVHCSRNFDIGVGDRQLKLHGAFFSQQNGITHACAHAALRAALMSSPVYNGPKITNRFINETLNLKPGAGKDGLNPIQMIAVAEKVGWQFQFANFNQRADVDCPAFIYPLIESGYPVILGMERPPNVAHVVTVLGHTLNTDRWMPEARRGYAKEFPQLPSAKYISSSEWADHFIVHDDNYGMYLTLPESDIRSMLLPRYNPNLHPNIALGLVPHDIVTGGFDAEQIAIARLANLLELKPDPENNWFREIQKHHDDGKVVCRTLALDVDTYLSAMAAASAESGQEFTADEWKLLKASLKDRFWVTEIMIPHVYTGNKRKLGDIITRPDFDVKKPETMQPVSFAWLPGMAWVGGESSPRSWPFYSHIPLLRGVDGPGCGPSDW